MINILLPYENAPKYYKLWAVQEESINFREDIASATRCTLSFAATELVSYLGKLGLNAQVVENEDFTICLLCEEKEQMKNLKTQNLFGELICMRGQIL